MQDQKLIFRQNAAVSIVFRGLGDGGLERKKRYQTPAKTEIFASRTFGCTVLWFSADRGEYFAPSPKTPEDNTDSYIMAENEPLILHEARENLGYTFPVGHIKMVKLNIQ